MIRKVEKLLYHVQLGWINRFEANFFRLIEKVHFKNAKSKVSVNEHQVSGSVEIHPMGMTTIP